MKKLFLFLAVAAGAVLLPAARPAQAAAAQKGVAAEIVAVRDSDLAKIASAGQAGRKTSFARKMAGKVLLRVQGRGEAYYINPADLKKYYLGRPGDAWRVSAGNNSAIVNQNIKKINKTEASSKPEKKLISAGEAKLPALALKRTAPAAASGSFAFSRAGIPAEAAIDSTAAVNSGGAGNGSGNGNVSADNSSASAASAAAGASDNTSQTSAGNTSIGGNSGNTEPAVETIAGITSGPAAGQAPSNPPSADVPPESVPPPAPPVETAAPSAPVAPEEPVAPVFLISPVAGEKIILGSAYTVRWDPAAIKGFGAPPARVIITLLSAGREARMFSAEHPDLPNSGNYLWSAPLDLPPGGNYTIRVWNNAGYSHTSDYIESGQFSLIRP